MNLPCHLVVIKGTRMYEGGGYRDYDQSTLLQMAGRAGRPGLDDHGVCVIMTQARTTPAHSSLPPSSRTPKRDQTYSLSRRIGC